MTERDPRPRVTEPPRAWTGLLFLLRRLAFIAVVAFAIVLFSTLGIYLARNSTTSGRPLRVVEALGPAFEMTLELFGQLLRGDLEGIGRGVLQTRDATAAEVLGAAFLKSGELLGLALGIAALLGIAAGGLAASRRHSVVALPTLTATVIGVSIPSFLLALLLQIADIKVYQRTGMGLFPIHGLVISYRKSFLPHIFAPALVLAARPVAYITRVTFISLSEIFDREFVRTARAKGLRRAVIFRRHILRNAGVSVLTAIVVSLRFAVGSLPIVEIFFSWSGIGVLMLEGIYAGDEKLVALLALGLGVAFLLLNLFVDLLYPLIDPRLRNGESEENGKEAA
jgi:ABC-type dipeptide/oligopeptide/nickel transport system permease component